MALTKVPLDFANDVHYRIISTTSKHFSGNDKCDWRKLGFQSGNPMTDTRGMGILGILMMLYMGETYPERAQ